MLNHHFALVLKSVKYKRGHFKYVHRCYGCYIMTKTEAFNAPKVATLLGNHLGLPSAYSYSPQFLAGEL